MKKEVLKNRKKMIYDMMSTKGYVPMRAREIAVLLQIPKGKRKELEEVLKALTDEGKIEAVSYTHLDVYKRQVQKAEMGSFCSLNSVGMRHWGCKRKIRAEGEGGNLQAMD